MHVHRMHPHILALLPFQLIPCSPKKLVLTHRCCQALAHLVDKLAPIPLSATLQSVGHLFSLFEFNGWQVKPTNWHIGKHIASTNKACQPEQRIARTKYAAEEDKLDHVSSVKASTIPHSIRSAMPIILLTCETPWSWGLPYNCHTKSTALAPTSGEMHPLEQGPWGPFRNMLKSSCSAVFCSVWSVNLPWGRSGW